MQLQRFWVGWTLFACLAASVVSAAPRWVRLETEDFVIVSDARESEIIDFATGYSAFRYAFRTLLVPPGKRVPRSEILLFRRASDFESRAPRQKDFRSRTVCHGGELDGGAFLALAVDGDRDAALQIAYEFETIWGLRRVGYALPLWMSQGTGEVMSTLDTRKGACVIGARRGNFGELGSSSLGWQHFFDLNTGSEEYSGPRSKGRFHAQAWALMHWILLKDGETLPRLQSLAEAVRTQPSLEAVESVLQVRPEQLNEAINRHLFGFKPLKLPFDERKVRAGYHIVPGAEAEAHALMANLAADSERPADADRELQLAQKLAPEAPCVLEALARRELRQRRVREAGEFYRRAIAAGSENPRSFVISAMARLNESSSGGVDYSGAGGNNVAEAIAELRKAIELDPGNTEAYQQLGRAFFLAPVPSAEWLPELSRGITEDPATAIVREYRALLFHRLKRTDEYLQDLEAIVTNPNTAPQLAGRLEGRWLKAAFERDVSTVNKLVAKHHFEEAGAYAAKARASAAGERLSAEYGQLAAYVEEQSSWVALMKLKQAQQWAEAADAAQAFLEKFPESKRHAEVERLRDEARAHPAASPDT